VAGNQAGAAARRSVYNSGPFYSKRIEMQLPEFNLAGVTDEQIDALTESSIYQFLHEHSKNELWLYIILPTRYNKEICYSLADLAFAFRDWCRDGGCKTQTEFMMHLQYAVRALWSGPLDWIKAGLKVMRDWKEKE
jgi:hypothetical protein